MEKPPELTPSEWMELRTKVLAVVRKFLRTRPWMDLDPEDVAQETLSRVWKQYPSYQVGEIPLHVWAFGFLELVKLELQRKSRKSRELASRLVSEPPGLDSLFVNVEAAFDCFAAVMQLAPPRRRIVLMRFWGQCTVAEIATLERTHRSRINRQLGQAMRVMKRFFGVAVLLVVAWFGIDRGEHRRAATLTSAVEMAGTAQTSVSDRSAEFDLKEKKACVTDPAARVMRYASNL